MANPFVAKRNRDIAALGEALRALYLRYNKYCPFEELDNRDQKHWLAQGEFLYEEVNRINQQKET